MLFFKIRKKSQETHRVTSSHPVSATSAKNLILIISISINVLILVFIILYALNNKESLVQKFIEKTHTAGIVMFGDSHTARGSWFSLFKRFDVKRSGYSGFTSGQLKFVIKKSVIEYKPEICFIQCGGNDINKKCFSVSSVINNYEVIIDSLKSYNIIPVVQSLFYRHKNPVYNNIIDSLNLSLIQLAREKNVDYLDINKDLIGINGLKKEFTVDGLHLNSKGYKIWGEKIRSYLKTNPARVSNPRRVN